MIEIFSAPIRKRVDNFLATFGYVRVKRPVPKNYKVLTLTDRDLMRTIILNTIRSTVGYKSPANDEMASDLSHRIISALEGSKSISLTDHVREQHDNILADRMITYVLACGIASHWELTVKNFAQKLQIEVFSETAFKGQKSPGFRRLEDIIEDIKKALPKLDLKLARTKNLRDSLIHCNFHQLKTYAAESQKKSVRESFEGSVWQIPLGGQNSDPVAIREITELEEVKKVGIYGWFIETSTSALFESVMLELKERTEDLSCLILLQGLSFDETSWGFQHLCLEGQKLTDSEISTFKEVRKVHLKNPQYADAMFARLHQLLK
jgi:hypothetical protein